MDRELAFRDLSTGWQVRMIDPCACACWLSLVCYVCNLFLHLFICALHHRDTTVGARGSEEEALLFSAIFLFLYKSLLATLLFA